MSLAEDFQSGLESLKNFDFNDIDFENVGSWPLAVKAVSWLLAFVVAIFLGYKFDIADFNDQLAAERAKETELKQSYERKAFQAANLDDFRKQMEEMEASFGALVGQLPSDTEVPGLLEDITNKGMGAGLEFKSIELQAEVIKEFYVELPILIQAKGTYHDIGAFVSGVAGLPRIVTLHNFSVKPSLDDVGSLVLEITAKTYRYRDETSDKKGKKGKKRGKK